MVTCRVSVGLVVPACVRLRFGSLAAGEGLGDLVFTGDLPPSDHAASSLDPFARGRLFRPPSWVVTPATNTGPPPRPAATADGAPAPSPKARRAPSGRFPRSPATDRQGRRPATPEASPRTTATLRAASPAGTETRRTKRS